MSKKISQLPELTTVLDDDVLPVVNAGATKRVKKSNLLKEVVEDLGTKAGQVELDAHTEDDSIHFTQEEISVTESQVIDLDKYSQAEVDGLLAGKANASHNHTASQITDFNTAADARITAQKAQANGVATLGADSKIPTSQLPALAITEVYTVNSQAAQLALSADEGDIAVRTDLNKSYIHNGGTSGTMADWQELLTPTDTVISVNGQTGAVTLTKTDVGLGNVDNTSDANKPVSTAQQAALDAKASATALSSHTGDTSNPHTVTKNQVGLGNVTNDAQAKADFSGYSSKATPVDADTTVINDSAASGAIKKLSWANIKATLKTYFDSLYAAVSHTHSTSDITSGSLAQARQSVLASGGYLIAPWDQYPASNVSATSASSNNVHVVAFVPKATLSVASIHFDIQAASAGGLCSVGVYSADGTTKLIDSGTKSTTSTGAQSTTLGSPVTLFANTLYWVAYTHDNTTSAVRGLAGALTGVSGIFNAGTVQMGTAANNATAGALPSSLGTITAASRAAPIVKLQG